MNTQVFGVVVTYHPDLENIQNILESAKQVDRLVVVDNGSGSEIESQLDKVALQTTNIDIVKNGDNLGIDVATNIGIQMYIDKYQFVLTLDQDSILGENMVDTMLTGFDEVDDRQCVIIGPNIINNGHKESSDQKYQKVDLLIASGMLIQTNYLKEHGLLDEYFFIGANDTDLSLRVRSQGYSLYQSSEALLHHSMGYCTTHRFLGKNVITENYSPFRRYFNSRNSTEILVRYITKYQKISINFWFNHIIKSNIKIILFESSKYQKLKYGFLGVFDWVFRHDIRRY